MGPVRRQCHHQHAARETEAKPARLGSPNRCVAGGSGRCRGTAPPPTVRQRTILGGGHVGRLPVLFTAALLAVVMTPGVATGSPGTLAGTVGGSLTCAGGQVVWLTERTSAGITTVTIGTFVFRQVKQNWSTTTLRSGLTSADWQVTSTGAIDRSVTRAYCGP
jgi:hypothetical protein